MSGWALPQKSLVAFFLFTWKIALLAVLVGFAIAAISP
jgi:hypothetical protein